MRQFNLKLYLIHVNYITCNFAYSRRFYVSTDHKNQIASVRSFIIIIEKELSANDSDDIEGKLQNIAYCGIAYMKTQLT